VERRDELIEQIEECEDQLLRIFARDRSHPLLSTDLTMQQLKALLLLSFEGSASGHELADGLGVSLATVTGIVDRLVARGLAERKDDPRDRRVRRVALAEEGTELLQRLRTAGREHRRRLLYRLDNETLSKLVDAMDALRVAAESELPDQPETPERTPGAPVTRPLGRRL
jgi:DNA-binding MarR family transcriptional regulator